MNTLETTEYLGFSDCRRLANGVVDLVISAGFGPRVLRFGFVGQRNLLAELADLAEGVPASEFKLYGGHRLWHAPEDPVTTYQPDNTPIDFSYDAGIVSIVQPTDPKTSIQKSLDISLSETGASVLITHRITNQGIWPVTLAAWALTMFAPGGRAIVPTPPYISHTDRLTPTNSLVLWAYTSLSDPRFSFGRKAIVMHCDPANSEPQKIGLAGYPGWLAYVLDNTLFVKQYEVEVGQPYPDFGSSAEVFFNHRFVELESLSPLVTLNPGDSVEHVEQWSLAADCAVPTSAVDAESRVLPVIHSLLDERFNA